RRRGPGCGEDRAGRSGSVEVSHRRAGLGRDLHQRRTRCVVGAAQDLAARAFLGELALSDELLTNGCGDMTGSASSHSNGSLATARRGLLMGSLGFGAMVAGLVVGPG